MIGVDVSTDIKPLPLGQIINFFGLCGKGVNLIIPNLLGKSHYQRSFVVIDPKGENAAIMARYQREIGQEVLVLDLGNLVTKSKENATYIPPDLLQKSDPEALVDDASVIAEMIVPPSQDGEQFLMIGRDHSSPVC